MLAKVWSCAIVGLDAIPIEVEVDIASQGLPCFTIVGLPDKAVEESRERVRSALKNSGADFPAKRITVNLAPADLPKEGPSYDLPIAIGILLASGQLQDQMSEAFFTGELSLNGDVRPISGILSQVLLARERHIKQFFLPVGNAPEAAYIFGVDIYPVTSLKELFLHLTCEKLITKQEQNAIDFETEKQIFTYDLKDIHGQEQAKRALEIAAAGGHNILLKGPPGAGKTLLARTLPSILPNMTYSEMIEVTKIYSIAGMLPEKGVIFIRPFRSPHHTTSLVGLIGGGTIPKPGEISLAHRGVLFLDELPEFPKIILESLRQPLEDGVAYISRSHGRVTFPTKCMVVAAQNPCPCGYFGDKLHTCTCSPMSVLRYKKRISGPLLDRIDIHLEVPAVKIEKLATNTTSSESSETVRKRVQFARDIQSKRFAGTTLTNNADMTSKDLKYFCPVSEDCLTLLHTALEKLHLSARSYHRIIKLSRTIADLEQTNQILPQHIAEALQYRPL
ncbi:MAG TPA: YifB family Mg chelatase-like AAA ATPase [Patescibacteria group bacterium]